MKNVRCKMKSTCRIDFSSFAFCIFHFTFFIYSVLKDFTGFATAAFIAW